MVSSKPGKAVRGGCSGRMPLSAALPNGLSALSFYADGYASVSYYGKAVRARVIELYWAWWCMGGHSEGGEVMTNGWGERDVLG